MGGVPTDLDNPCNTCQASSSSEAAYKQCVRCYTSPRQRLDCDACSALRSEQEQQQCYACASSGRANATDSYSTACGGCFALPAEDRARCIACAMDASVPSESKRYCSTCQAAGLTTAQRQRCMACMRTGRTPACDTCVSVAGASDEAFGACTAAYALPAAVPDADDCGGVEGGAAAVAKCFRCVVGARLTGTDSFTPFTSCAGCIGGPNEASCVSCNADARVPATAKSWCQICASQEGAAAREGCLRCLQQQPALKDPSAYRAACKL